MACTLIVKSRYIQIMKKGIEQPRALQSSGESSFNNRRPLSLDLMK